MTDYTPRAASSLLSSALARLDVIQPEGLRDPVRDILRAGIEVCVSSRSLLGKPIQYTINLAQAIIDAPLGVEPRKPTSLSDGPQ
ncbi:hypothetical protein ACFWMR_01945 [Amycolatopsis thailandensis]|uniref:hypothetical protein n=1 Tax=Amycolatopsis thailandensis TaxID=589330 RepID=UPI003660823B